MLTLLRDLRYSARSFGRTPGFTAALLLTVAVGIGSYATIAAFTSGLQRDLASAAGEGDSQLGRLLSVLSWTVALVFVTASANVAGLLLSRASRRTHETASRAALGATRARLALHVLADSIVVAVGGGLLGLLLAWWTSMALPALLYSEDVERLHVTSAWTPAIKAASLYTVTMLVCALAPLMDLQRHSTMSVLRRTGDGATTSVGSLRSVLVIAQITACVVLVVGTAMLFEGFRSAVRTIRAQQIGEPIVAILQPRGGFGRPDVGREYFATAERLVSRVPGVSGIAWGSALPGARVPGIDVRFEPPGQGWTEAVVDTSTPEGYRLAGLRVKPGRYFGGGDSTTSCRVALVNEAAAKEFFEGIGLGRSLLDEGGRRVDIVGIVKEPPKEPMFYFYSRQVPDWASDDVVERRVRLPLPAERAKRMDGTIDVAIVSPRYFQALGAALVQGTGLGHVTANDCGVAMVNREAADQWFGGNAIGGAIVDVDGARAEIVGVVESPALRVIERAGRPMAYFPTTQRYMPWMALIAQTEHATPELIAAIDAIVQGIDGAARPPQVMTLEERLVRTALGPERVASVFVAVCAVLALGLGWIGVYGVMADTVRQRQREIALRLALGAPASRIVGGVFRDGARLATMGGAIGMAIAWTILRVVHHADDRFGNVSFWTWLVCPAILLIVVAAATVLPARWALAVNPLTITRES